MFAAYAAVALGQVRRENHLLEALRTRDLIGQATGIVMERYGVDADPGVADRQHEVARCGRQPGGASRR